MPPGSESDPVSLDHFRRIIEVGWSVDPPALKFHWGSVAAGIAPFGFVERLFVMRMISPVVSPYVSKFFSTNFEGRQVVPAWPDPPADSLIFYSFVDPVSPDDITPKTGDPFTQTMFMSFGGIRSTYENLLGDPPIATFEMDAYYDKTDPEVSVSLAAEYFGRFSDLVGTTVASSSYNRGTTWRPLGSFSVNLATRELV